ncbi:hypothetical protein BC793_121110 [Actinoplanes xinjiangensis]|uniref:Uncharacterized protein n=1 Tax=Actinoplanes xinjiangensis TaxID=512350 RepID=A0A316F408_9ACTN|nr:hypothetical protein BC793_121110 [Actinoplanes xinjiangensis]GIF42810.1 hypothetical protein Axi01nite_71210 [Actinoplanes xinjiangensis]
MWCRQLPSRIREVRAVLVDFCGTLSVSSWRDPGCERPGVAGPVIAAGRETTPAGGRLRQDAVTILTALRYRGFATGVIAGWDPDLAAVFEAPPIAAPVDVVVFAEPATSPLDAAYLAGCRALELRPEHCLWVRCGDGGVSAWAGLGQDPVAVHDLVDVLALLPPSPGPVRIRGENTSGRHVPYRNDVPAARWLTAT